MTHVFAVWLGRFLAFPSQSIVHAPSTDPPMKIEVERLPDYRWRELGFFPLQRRE